MKRFEKRSMAKNVRSSWLGLAVDVAVGTVVDSAGILWAVWITRAGNGGRYLGRGGVERSGLGRARPTNGKEPSVFPEKSASNELWNWRRTSPCLAAPKIIGSKSAKLCSVREPPVARPRLTMTAAHAGRGRPYLQPRVNGQTANCQLLRAGYKVANRCTPGKRPQAKNHEVWMCFSFQLHTIGISDQQASELLVEMA
jgi:hypothetical protein